MYVLLEVVGQVVIYSFVHQLCASVSRNVEYASFDFQPALYCLFSVGF